MSFTTSASAPEVSLSRLVSVSGTPEQGVRMHHVNVDAARTEATPARVSLTATFSDAESPPARSPNLQVACQAPFVHPSGSEASSPPADGRRSTETAGARTRPRLATVKVYVAVASSSYACSLAVIVTATSVPHAPKSPRTFFSASCWVATYVGNRPNGAPHRSAVAAPSATSTRPRSDPSGSRT